MPLGENTQGHLDEPSLPLRFGDTLYVNGIQPLIGLLDFELEAIAFFQVFVGHFAVMDKNVISTTIRFGEAISFGRAKPLYGSSLHNSIGIFECSFPVFNPIPSPPEGEKGIRLLLTLAFYAASNHLFCR